LKSHKITESSAITASSIKYRKYITKHLGWVGGEKMKKVLSKDGNQLILCDAAQNTAFIGLQMLK